MKKRRQAPEINAGSMADIAFLLLIFWLVATTLKPDYGWKNQLKAEDEEPKIAVVTNSSDILRLYVKEDKLELDGKEASYEDIEKFINVKLGGSGSRLKVIVSADYEASYESYTAIVELAKKYGIKIIYNEI